MAVAAPPQASPRIVGVSRYLQQPSHRWRETGEIRSYPGHCLWRGILVARPDFQNRNSRFRSDWKTTRARVCAGRSSLLFQSLPGNVPLPARSVNKARLDQSSAIPERYPADPQPGRDTPRTYHRTNQSPSRLGAAWLAVDRGQGHCSGREAPADRRPSLPRGLRARQLRDRPRECRLRSELQPFRCPFEPRPPSLPIARCIRAVSVPIGQTPFRHPLEQFDFGLGQSKGGLAPEPPQ